MNTTNATRLIHTLIIALTLFASCGKNNTETSSSSSTTRPPVTRIVSFAPSVTEILYELGLGDKVCGVTQFCKYPPEAAEKEKIGGQIDRNYEAVVRLKPDLAVILKEQSDMIDFFNGYSIRYVVVGSDSVGEILESILAVANACYVSDRGKIIVENLRKQMGLVRVDNSGKIINTVKTVVADDALNNGKPKVLLCVSRDGTGTGAIGKCFVAGVLSFYDQLIDAAGGVNVMNGVKQAYPAINAEAIIRMAPDVIIELSMSYVDDQQKQQKNCDDWKALKNVPAVRNNKIYCLSGDYLTIPGPRIGLILEDFKNALRQR